MIFVIIESLYGHQKLPESSVHHFFWIGLHTRLMSSEPMDAPNNCAYYRQRNEQVQLITLKFAQEQLYHMAEQISGDTN